MHNGRDCARGRQVSKCDTCDLIDAEQRILELEDNVELLLQALLMQCKDVNPEIPMPDFMRIGECLAEIKAQAGRDGFIECYFALRRAEYGDVFDLVKSADDYANRLRQQAKVGE